MTGTRQAAHAFIDAWNSHSPEAVRDVFAPNGRLRDASNLESITGPAIVDSVKRVLERLPDIAFTLGAIIEDGDRVAFEWTLSGTVTRPDGSKVAMSTDGCDVCQVKDGKIVELHGYFDRAPLMEQMQRGAAPSAR
jgi:ketosteroid isomerase-like protein